MTAEKTTTANPFAQGGGDYARYRPEYPPGLAEWLASLAPGRALALDVGCGNGQLTRLLAQHFERVVGIDPSADQIAHAARHERIDYRCAPAEHLGVPDAGAGLITAAQAAHWFDLPAFYREVRRVAAPGAVLALVSYGVLTLGGPGTAFDARFQRFYRDQIGPYWPPERRLVDSGYAGIDFPFDEFAPPAFEIRLEWDLPAFLGYVQTWSAVRSARAAGQECLLANFAAELTALWDQSERTRPVVWPINMRIGRA